MRLLVRGPAVPWKHQTAGRASLGRGSDLYKGRGSREWYLIVPQNAFESWLKPDASGLLCEPGGFHIDPLRAVDRAIITHGHSDHARPGHGAVLATPETIAVMKARLGENCAGSFQALRYGETLDMGGTSVRLAPAGHILGSAQVVIECNGRRAVVSGDYKRRADPTCVPFELVRLRSVRHRGDVRPAGVPP